MVKEEKRAKPVVVAKDCCCMNSRNKLEAQSYLYNATSAYMIFALGRQILGRYSSDVSPLVVYFDIVGANDTTRGAEWEDAQGAR